jgi:hypothetical protein
MKKILYSSVLLAGVNAPHLHAQTDPNQSPVDLPEMVVTATRSETAKKQLSAAATVYTRNDIERLQVKALPDLLRGTTGLDVTQQGGYGQLASVFMRGTNSSHVLVLIDGIKVGAATTGTSPFELVPIDQVERVEIIRGPQSSLYGSEAIGGVIQIFTRKGGDSEKPTVTLDAGGGSYDTLKSSGTVSGKWKNSWYSVGASHINTQGFSARPLVPDPFGGKPLDQPDHDGYYNTAVNARLGHRFAHKAEMTTMAHSRIKQNSSIKWQRYREAWMFLITGAQLCALAKVLMITIISPLTVLCQPALRRHAGMQPGLTNSTLMITINLYWDRIFVWIKWAVFPQNFKKNRGTMSVFLVNCTARFWITILSMPRYVGMKTNSLAIMSPVISVCALIGITVSARLPILAMRLKRLRLTIFTGPMPAILT